MKRLAGVASCSLFQQVGGDSRIGFNLLYMVTTLIHSMVQTLLMQSRTLTAATEQYWLNAIPDAINNRCKSQLCIKARSPGSQTDSPCLNH